MTKIGSKRLKVKLACEKEKVVGKILPPMLQSPMYIGLYWKEWVKSILSMSRSFQNYFTARNNLHVRVPSIVFVMS